MSAPLAVFRADASPALGGGHVSRCLALAASLAAAGWRCVLAARAGTPDAAPAAASVPLLTLSESGEISDEPEALAAALPEGCDLLVVDHYRWSAAEERAARRLARRVAALDDLLRDHDADLVLDPTPGRGAEAYRGRVPPGCTVLAGAAWAPLAPRFRAARPAALAARAARRPERILVSLGLTDPADATSRVLAGLREAGITGPVDVVLGGAAPHRAAVAAALPPGGRLHIAPPDMPALIGAADLAIGAGGVSALERACLGLPSLLVEVAENQRAAIAGLVAAGAARALGPLEALAPRAVADAVASLLGDAGSLAAMAHAAAIACDGLGAARAAIVLAPERARDGTPVSLRPVTAEDEALLLAWQSSPEMRRHFRTPEVPTPSEHAAWLARSLADPDRLLFIILLGGRPAGLLRLDRCAGGDRERHEVSILVAPEVQRRGVGKAALALATRLVPESDLVAEVRPSNAASRALFASARFRETGAGLWRREAAS